MTNKFTILNIGQTAPAIVTFVFYEGNDLYDILEEAEKQPRLKDHHLIKTARFFLPLFELAARYLVRLLPEKGVPKVEPTDKKSLPTTKNGTQFPIFPQGAGLQLNQKEIKRALALFGNVLAHFQTKFPGSKHRVLYVPSVASVYKFSGRMGFQGYRGIRFSIPRGREPPATRHYIRSNQIIVSRNGLAIL